MFLYHVDKAYLQGCRTLEYEHFQAGTWAERLADDGTFSADDYDRPAFSGSFSSHCQTPIEDETYEAVALLILDSILYPSNKFTQIYPIHCVCVSVCIEKQITTQRNCMTLFGGCFHD